MARTIARLAELTPSRVCIIKPSSLGDVVHALPILSALRRRWPAAQLDWVVHRPFRDLLRGHPDLDELIVVRRRASRGPGAAEQETDEAIRGVVPLARRLAAGRYDLTIDLQGLLRSGLMALATRAPVRVGPADAREGARWFYTHHVDAPRRELHAVRRTMRMAEAFGAIADAATATATAGPCFHLPIADADHAWAAEVLADVPRPRLVLNLGARWLTKRWPVEHYAALARRAIAEFGAGTIAVGAAEDRPLVDELVQRLAPSTVLDVCGRTRLPQLAALCRAADLTISNDTGPLHLAAAAGARVVGIYTCTSPELTGPFGPNAQSVRSHVWCAPSFRKTCGRLECMTELAPERVWPVVRPELERAMSTAAPATASASASGGRGPVAGASVVS